MPTRQSPAQALACRKPGTAARRGSARDIGNLSLIGEDLDQARRPACGASIENGEQGCEQGGRHRHANSSSFAGEHMNAPPANAFTFTTAIRHHATKRPSGSASRL